MKLSVKALAIAGALIWGGAILLVGLGGLLIPTYGAAFLDVVSSIYPGYHAAGGLLDTLVGTGYGLLDGAIGGALVAWIYNVVAGKQPAG